MNATQTVNTASANFAKVLSSVEEIKNDAPQRFPEAASFGDYMRQGDVYVELLEVVPQNSKKVEEMHAQVVPGNTKGSRHILDSLDGVKMFTKTNPTELDGPILLLEKERVLTHPEHGNIILPADRVYAITFQRAFANEMKRAQD